MTRPPFIQHYAINTVGRDFAVGDIHGCFDALDAALKRIQFNEKTDRLFSVGDLIDRGAQSHQVLAWLDKPWFHAVQGNHEEMARDFVQGRARRDASAQDAYQRFYGMCGGHWLIDLPTGQQEAYVAALAALPYLIEVQTGHGPVGIVHADVAGSTWAGMVERFADETEQNLNTLLDACLWRRERLRSGDASGVPDRRAVMVGHTPVPHGILLGNVYHLDTGGWTDDGYFTFVELSSLIGVPACREFNRECLTCAA